MIFLELDSLLLSPFHFRHWGKQMADASYGKCLKKILLSFSFFTYLQASLNASSMRMLNEDVKIAKDSKQLIHFSQFDYSL